MRAVAISVLSHSVVPWDEYEYRHSRDWVTERDREEAIQHGRRKAKSRDQTPTGTTHTKHAQTGQLRRPENRQPQTTTAENSWVDTIDNLVCNSTSLPQMFNVPTQSS
jgi:hypothetical protein